MESCDPDANGNATLQGKIGSRGENSRCQHGHRSQPGSWRGVELPLLLAFRLALREDGRSRRGHNDDATDHGARVLGLLPVVPLYGTAVDLRKLLRLLARGARYRHGCCVGRNRDGIGRLGDCDDGSDHDGRATVRAAGASGLCCGGAGARARASAGAAAAATVGTR